MKRLGPWALLAVTLGASCTLDLAGKAPESAGGGGVAAATTSTEAGPSSSGAGGAGGSTASVSVSASASMSASVSSSSASSTGTGGGPVWTRRRVLDLDIGFNGTPNDFAVLVLLKNNRIDYNKTRSNGEDLRFTDTSNQPLPYEIERWDEAGVSVVWVGVGTIDQSGGNHTTLRMYYGNPGADDAQDAKGIWSSSYAGVWHLSQTDGELADSSGKTAVATNHGSTRLQSIVGDGRNFVAANGQYIDTLNATNVKRFTVEAWVKGNHDAKTGAGPNGPVMREKNYQLMWDHNPMFVGKASMNTMDNDPAGQNWKTADFIGLTANTWYYLATTFAGDKLRAYKDGVKTDETPFPVTDPQPEAETAKIGRHAFNTAATNFFDGMVDEVRISTQSRSDKWIQAQNKSMRDAGFVGFGAEEQGSYSLP